jgi:hypothetical protein
MVHPLVWQVRIAAPITTAARSASLRRPCSVSSIDRAQNRFGKASHGPRGPAGIVGGEDDLAGRGDGAQTLDLQPLTGIRHDPLFV